MFELTGRKALVTGASGGIGEAIARVLHAQGAVVGLHGTRREKLDALAADLGDRVHVFPADLTDRDAVKALGEEAESTLEGVDILVNNAGIVHAADFLDITEDDFERVMRVNLKGQFLCGQAAARLMVEKVKNEGPAGAIVNMSSINATVAIPNQVPYCVSKGGVNQLTKVMAMSLAPYGIRVNAVGPGSIMTEMLASVNDDPEARNRILSRTPLLRIGETSEIASTVAFLASDEAGYITGQTIYADGSRLALNYTVPVPEED